MTSWIATAAALLLLLLPLAAQDLESVRAERDPEKRYRAALDVAWKAVDDARKHVQAGDQEPFTAALDRVLAGVRLCDETLRATGKDPSRNPKHFKRAELRIRDLLRRLRSLHEEAGFENREPVEQTRVKVQQIHDELLLDIMGRRK